MKDKYNKNNNTTNNINQSDKNKNEKDFWYKFDEIFWQIERVVLMTIINLFMFLIIVLIIMGSMF